MELQPLVADAMVLACSVYAAWVLSPVGARRVLGTWLARLPLGAPLRRRLQRAASVARCDCNDCHAVVSRPSPTPQRVIRIHVVARSEDGNSRAGY